MLDTVKSSPHQAPKINNTITTNGTGTAAISAAITLIPILMRRAAVKLTFINDRFTSNEKEISHGRVSWQTQ